jgi:hypothetical protein
MAGPLKLPPGATLVDDEGMKLPHGATLVNDSGVDVDAVQKSLKAQAAPGDKVSAAPGMFSKGWFKEKLNNAVDYGSNLLPAAGGLTGGTVGAAAGPVTAVGGAALGGAAGESARQLVRRAMGWEVPQTSMDAAKDIGVEGAKQGAYEAGGRIVGALGKGLAPKMAEVAAAPGKRLLKEIPEDVNIGQTILDKSKGVRPKTITRSLNQNISDASKEADQVLSDAANRGVTVPLDSARKVVADEVQSAVQKNAHGYIPEVNKVGDQLTKQVGPNGQIVGNLPNAVDPIRARQLRQGIDQTIGTWNPEVRQTVAPLQRRVYGALTNEIHNAVPGTAELDKSMTSMIPAKNAMWNVSYNPDITGRLFNRIARPTGALTGMGLGAYEGSKSDIPGGTIVGGLMGLAAPELLASPTGQMMIARALNSRVLPQATANIPRVAAGLLKPTAEDERKKLAQKQ